MKAFIKLFIAILFLASCSESKKSERTPPSLYAQPKVVPLNLDGGYAVNQITGDSIRPIINSLGDTVITGVQLNIQGKLIHLDSVIKPKVIPYTPSNKVSNAHQNTHKIPDELTTIPINEDSLKSISVPKILVNDTLHYIINSIGDTVRTGRQELIIGKALGEKKTRSVIALPFLYNNDKNSRIKYLSIYQGLGLSSVTAILEDKWGNFWFGGENGVTKYDGSKFERYTLSQNPQKNNVSSITEDDFDNIWLSTFGGGIYKYDGFAITQYTQNEGLISNYITCSWKGRNGNIWFGTWRGGLIRFNGDSITHFTNKEGLISNSVSALLESRDGRLWIANRGGGLSVLKNERITYFTNFSDFSMPSIYSIAEDKNGNIWLGSNGKGVFKYNHDFLIQLTTNEGLSNNIVKSIIEDNDGSILFGTSDGGVNMLDGNSIKHLTKSEGLNSNVVNSLIQDNCGNIWIGTSNGVNVSTVGSFVHYTKDVGFNENSVSSIIEGKNGVLWVGTKGGGVSKFHEESFHHNTIQEGLSSNWITSLLEDKNGNIWIGTSNGLNKFDGKTINQYSKEGGLSHNYVSSIIEDKKGNIWISGLGGAMKFNGRSFFHLTEQDGLSNKRVQTIIEDKNGNLWFASWGGGLSKYNGKTITHFTEKEGLNSNDVWSLAEDNDGNLWIGTKKGLCKFNGQAFFHYPKVFGLSSNDVWTILKDSEQNCWLGANDGISKIVFSCKNCNDIDIIRSGSYLKDAGLLKADYFTSYLDSKNRIWWGSTNGLTMLDLKEQITNPNPPAVYLKQLDINEQFIDYRNITDSLCNEIEFSSVQRFENYPLSLELPYYKNHLTFHYVAIDWSAPHKIQYSYLIEGVDKTWSQPTQEVKADYRNLPYGKHTFKVCAIGESGEWSDPFEYSFTILPPWYHTWWARGGYACTGIFLLIGTVRLRTAALKKRQKELEEEVDNATTVIKEQKEEVEKSYKEIKDSIEYAKRIQTAILPPAKLVKEYLADSFILYLPKDVVAGDFYWMEQKDGKTLFAAADCTGHGVPGAMVSVVCNNGLNRSVREYGITDPGEILNKTREIVIEEFEKSEEEVKDGMDIALCSIEDNVLKYAGANNPLWLIRNEELIEIKADKQPIGVFDHSKPYTTHTIELLTKDTFYIFSDGFADQFGGEQEKKFMKGNMKKLFLSVQHETMEKQKELIEKAFMQWKGNLEQIDDVCIIGVRV